MIKHVQLMNNPDKYASISENSNLLIFNDSGIPIPLENVVVKNVENGLTKQEHVQKVQMI